MAKNILWTGGWDSTFRILDLVLTKKESVQPFYILDSDRNSTPLELETMDKIKKLIIEKDPESKDRILDHIMISINKIPINEKITNDYSYLQTLSHLGSQYDWLARYADSMQMNNIELCIHLDDKAEFFIKNDVELIKNDADSYYKLKDKPSKSELRIFSYFHFPLLKMTKLEMGETAKKNGFHHIMEETWFCFNPKKDGTPCGMCNPCKYTREEGLGRRVPDPAFLMKLNKKVKGKLSDLKRKLKYFN